MPDPVPDPTQTAPEVTQAPRQSIPTATQSGGPSPMVVDLQPAVALGVLTALALLAAIVSDNHLGWFLTAAACAYGAWFVRRRGIRWPSDVQGLLAIVRLGPLPAIEPSIDGDHADGRTGDPQPQSLAPSRPRTLPEMFGTAAKVVVRNWPSLIGIPMLVCIGFVGAFLLLMAAVLTAVMSAPDAAVTGFALSVISSPAALIASMVVTLLVTAVIGLPGDALLLGLSVIATDRAVRGEPVRLASLVSDTWRRLFAICRLTVLYYLPSFVPPLLFIVILAATGFDGFAVVALLMLPIYVATFVAGIIFSLAPVVLIVEELGVIESFRRAAQLARGSFLRLLAIHAAWIGCVLAASIGAGILMTIGLPSILFLVLLGGLLAMFRALQMLIYIDLRMRQENVTPGSI